MIQNGSIYPFSQLCFGFLVSYVRRGIKGAAKDWFFGRTSWVDPFNIGNKMRIGLFGLTVV